MKAEATFSYGECGKRKIIIYETYAHQAVLVLLKITGHFMIPLWEV